MPLLLEKITTILNSHNESYKVSNNNKDLIFKLDAIIDVTGCSLVEFAPVIDDLLKSNIIVKLDEKTFSYIPTEKRNYSI